MKQHANLLIQTKTDRSTGVALSAITVAHYSSTIYLTTNIVGFIKFTVDQSQIFQRLNVDFLLNQNLGKFL